MPVKEDILKALLGSEGEFISGEDLAKKFGKSRAAVWKAIKTLEKDGYSVDAVTNRGYRLCSDNDLIHSRIIEQKLTCDAQVIYYPSVDSTSTQAKRLLLEGKSGNILVVADEQTAGRGRQGKTFYSPALTGIYMSLVVHPSLQLQNAVTITTAASVAVCRAVEKLSSKKPVIKWVNDVYLDDKKICGILTEAITDFESGVVESIIIGIGVNIKTKHFPKDAGNAVSLGEDIKRADLIGAIANELCSIIDANDLSYMDYYRSHSMLIGKEIDFIQNGKVTSAIAAAIDEKGGLVVKLSDGSQQVLRSGEISIRKK